MKHSKFHLLPFMIALILAVQSVFGVTGSFSSYAQTGLVNTDRLNLRSGPGTTYSSVKMLSTNTKVEVKGSVTGNDGYTWYQVTCGGYSGYLRSDFVNLNVTYNAADEDFEAYLTQQGFPESYKNDLRGLHQKYPNWVFVAQHTGLDWQTALAEESKIGKNLVYTSNISSWKSTEEGAFDWANNYWPGFDGSTWVAASSEIIAHYMDPRNFITDPYIFQFQQQTYDPSMQTREGLEKMVKGTFLEGAVGEKAKGNSSGVGPGTYSGKTSEGSTTGPGGTSSSSSDTGVSFSGPVASAGDILFSLFGGITSFAEWKESDGNWVYLNSDGSYYANGWFWIDGNNDGISECFYFDSNGIMASDTTVGEYIVNKDGQWTVDGVIQTKKTGTTSTGTTYVDLIMQAAEQSGVSPYILASMIIQEQGTSGTSEMISGTNRQYPGYYNFYNINAYEHDGMTAVQSGLKYASESGNGNRPWNTVEKGIVGGAIAYGASFVDCGQDTLYLKKFNVQGDNKYKHQFMSNVIAASQEGSKLSNAYSSDIKNSALVFKIPVYLNMPESKCELPTKNGNPNNKLSSLVVQGFNVTPTFNMNTTEYSLIVDSTVAGVNIDVSTIDSKATVSGNGWHDLTAGLNTVSVKVTAENGDERIYTVSINKKEGGSVSTSASGPGSTSGPGPGTTAENTGSEITVSNPSGTSSGESLGQDSNVVIGAAPM